MSSLWIPPREAQQRKREEHLANVGKMVQRFNGTMDYWTRRFREDLNDDRLEVVFFPPHAKAPGVVPGRFTVVRDNTPNPIPSLIPIETPDGKFKEPDSGDIERLRGMDLQNPQVANAKRKQAEELERQAERDKARQDAERWDELKERYAAAFQTSISMNKSAPWTQNAAGRKKDGRKKAGWQKGLVG